MNEIYNIIHIEQDTPEWLEFRKRKASSSCAAPLMKASRWDTPLSLWEKTVFDKSIPMNSAMARGKIEEPKAREWFSNEIGIPFVPVVLEMKDNPRIISSIDGFFALGSKVIGCEIKSPGLNDHLLAMNGNVPEDYQWQCQHHMMVSGCKEWWYVSWDGYKGIPINIERDEEKIEALKKEELSFLERIDSFTPPEPVDQDWRILENEYAQRLAKDYNEISDSLKKFGERKDRIKEELEKIASAFHPRTKIGDILKIQKIVRKGNVDYSAIPELKGINIDKYRKDPIESWRIN